MFKSIFSKYMTAVSIIVVLSFLVLATVLAAVIGDYGKSDRQAEVEHISTLAAEIPRSHGKMLLRVVKSPSRTAVRLKLPLSPSATARTTL